MTAAVEAASRDLILSIMDTDPSVSVVDTPLASRVRWVAGWLDNSGNAWRFATARVTIERCMVSDSGLKVAEIVEG